MLVRPAADKFHDIADRPCFVVIRQRLAAQCRIHAFEAVQRVAVKQLAHIAIEFVNDFLDAEKIALNVQNLIIVKKAGKREMIAGDQHCQRERESKPPLSGEICKQHKHGVGAKRRLQVLRHIDRCPLEQIPSPGDQQPDRRWNNPIAPIYPWLGFACLAEKGDHRDQQWILDDCAEDKW